MNQTDVLNNIAEKTGVSKTDVKNVLDAYASHALETLRREDEFPLHGIGKLKAKNSAARKGRNPATGEEIDIKSSRQVRLSAGKSFKDGLQT